MHIERVPWRALHGHLKPLTLAYLTEFDRLRRHYAVDWRDERALAARAKAAGRIEDATADAIEAYLKQHGAPTASMAALAKLRHGACAIVTGQQPGLAGGPMYDLYKAVTALRLARHLDDRGVPAVAVFWNHADDHNPADIGGVSLPDAENRPVTVAVELADDGRPAGARSVDTAGVVTKMAALLPTTPDRGAVEAMMRETAAPTLAAWFARVLLRWLGGSGLIVLEPSHLVGPRSAAVLDRARREPALVERAVAAATERLAADGFEPPIGGGIGSSLFVIRDGVRRRLERSGDQLFLEGAPFDGRGRLSAAVALRPVLQDAALPTAVYVGGPNECAYFAQLGEVYRAFDVAMPAVFPRASATIVEPRVERVIEKFQLGADDLFVGRERLVERVSARAQKGLLEEVSRAELETRSRIKSLEASVAQVDRSLVDAARKTAEKMGRLYTGFRERIVEAQRQADQVSVSQIEKLCNHVVPGGVMQERAFTPWYYLAMNGTGLIADLVEALDPFAGAHVLLRIASRS